ncbi:hypothetical protein D8Z77_06395 [Brevibacillus laterosporus]|nr:hypothetical protein D8Z77_06395 [Brevibacillus laterosporus]
MHMLNGCKVSHFQRLLIQQLSYTDQQISKVEANIKNISFSLRKTRFLLISLKRSLRYEKELATLKETKETVIYELSKPTIKEVSVDWIQNILINFSQVLFNVSPEKQKDLLHSIINRITIKFSNNIKERCIENIELFFDTTLPVNFVPICDKAPPD